MTFNQNWDPYFPPKIADHEKSAIREFLDQFFGQKKTEIDYKDFFSSVDSPNLIMQGDILNSLPYILNEPNAEVKFTPTLVVSNTCDLELTEKTRLLNKCAIVAPVINLETLKGDLLIEGKSTDQLRSFVSSLKRQEISHLFYIPPVNEADPELVASLDKIYHLELDTFNQYAKPNDEIDRYAFLGNKGYYLFLYKILFHLCRIPSDDNR